MKFPRSTNLLKLAWLASFSLPTAHAQSTGGSNLPTQLITYRLTEIIADPTSAITLPIALSTSLIGNSPTPGDPVASPQDTDIQWSGSTGEPLFTPSSGGSSVKLDFTQPFVKTLSDAATTITATYTFGSGPSSGSGSDPSLPPPTVYPSSQTKNLDRIYLDFWVANTEDATDDVVLVRTTDSELASGEKTVLHWAKVTVKHSRGQSLKLKIENATSSGKPLYFLDQEENPNTQTQDPQLSNKLEKEFDDGKFFWVGSAEKGAGVGKFKAQGDLGSGYKDAPEEKTVNLVPVDFEFKLERRGPPGPDEVRNYVHPDSRLQNGTNPDLRTDITIAALASFDLGAITTTRGNVDTFNPANGVCGADGKFKTTLSTREKAPALKVQARGAKSLEHNMLPALYKNQFHITGYSTPSEGDSRFTGARVTHTTLTTGSGATRRVYDITSPRAAKSDFLKSIAVEGEGYFEDGTHAVVSNRTTPGTSNPIETTTTITTNNLRPKGTRNRDLIADSSCAITRSSGNGIVIPDAVSVHVVGQAGNWSAIDQVSSTETGGVYHIDLYKGFDRAAADLISADTEVILLDY